MKSIDVKPELRYSPAAFWPVTGLVLCACISLCQPFKNRTCPEQPGSSCIHFEGLDGMLGKRLFRWFSFHVLFALFPLLALLLIHKTNNLSTEQDWNSPELVFFTFMVSAIALGDVYEMASRRGARPLTNILFTVLFLGAVWSIFVYGVYVHERLPLDRWVQKSLLSETSASVSIETIKAEYSILRLAKFPAIAFATLGTLVQILFGRLEDKWPLSQRY